MTICVSADVFVDWKQNVNEVTVRLRCGDGTQRKEDVRTSFTDKSCHVSFPGKSRAAWSSRGREDPTLGPGGCSSNCHLDPSEDVCGALTRFSCSRWRRVELPAAGGN